MKTPTKATRPSGTKVSRATKKVGSTTKRTTPTGRVSKSKPNIQHIVPKTSEATKILEAFREPVEQASYSGAKAKAEEPYTPAEHFTDRSATVRDSSVGYDYSYDFAPPDQPIPRFAQRDNRFWSNVLFWGAFLLALVVLVVILNHNYPTK